MTRLDEWAALCDAATEGPWRWAQDSGQRLRIRARLEPDVLGCGALNGPTDEDAAFVAAARTAMPALIAAVRRVEALAYQSDDGSEYVHVVGCTGEATCPACWAQAITEALGGAQ